MKRRRHGRTNRLLSMALAAALLLAITITLPIEQSASASGGPGLITVEPQPGGPFKPGDEVVVDFKLTNNPGFASMFLKVSYSDGLVATKIDTESRLHEGQTQPVGWTGPVGWNPGVVTLPDPISGQFYMVYAANVNFVAHTTTLFTVTFLVTPDAGEGTKNINLTFEGRDQIKGDPFKIDDNMDPPEVPVTITITPGTVEVVHEQVQITATAGSNGTASGGGLFKVGQSVTLTATPDTRYIFDGWYDGADIKVSEFSQYTFNATVEITLQARFLSANDGNIDDKLDNLLDDIDTDNAEEVNAAVATLKQIDNAALASAMRSRADVVANIAALESVFGGAANVSSNVDVLPAGQVTIIGAGLNITQAGAVTLNITPATQTVTINPDRYDAMLQIDMTLVGGGITADQLDVPVIITMPIPAGFTDLNRLRILHFEDADNYTTIRPLINDDGTTATFVLTGFSTFVFTQYTFIHGDVDGNGEIGINDLVMLARYLALHPVTINLHAANVTNTGGVGVNDLVLLARYLAKHPVTLGG